MLFFSCSTYSLLSRLPEFFSPIHTHTHLYLLFSNSLLVFFPSNLLIYLLDVFRNCSSFINIPYPLSHFLSHEDYNGSLRKHPRQSSTPTLLVSHQHQKVDEEMGGKSWSKEEEDYFWVHIIPFSHVRRGPHLAHPEQSFAQLGRKMQDAFGSLARRSYTGVCLGMSSDGP